MGCSLSSGNSVKQPTKGQEQSEQQQQQQIPPSAVPNSNIQQSVYPNQVNQQGYPQGVQQTQQQMPTAGYQTPYTMTPYSHQNMSQFQNGQYYYVQDQNTNFSSNQPQTITITFQRGQTMQFTVEDQATQYLLSGQLQLAQQAYQNIINSYGGQKSQQLAYAQYRLGLCLYFSKQYDEAKQQFTQCARIYKELNMDLLKNLD